MRCELIKLLVLVMVIRGWEVLEVLEVERLVWFIGNFGGYRG